MVESPAAASYDADALLALRQDPPRMGTLAMDARLTLFGLRTLLRPTPEHPDPQAPAVLRRDEYIALDSWPSPGAWQPGDRVLVRIEPDDEDGARRYVRWLLALAAHHAREGLAENPHLGPRAIAPYSIQPSGTHRLWMVSAARLALPAAYRVEARHDLLGIRLAQVALGFGADTLSGPIRADRHLPVAGVTRPDEATITGLRNLIEQAGLECALREDAAPRVHAAGEHTVRIKLADIVSSPKKES